MPSFAPELLIVLLLIVLNGAFAMSEMAIVSARKARLEQRAANGDRRARLALELANDPNELLSTIQVGITLIGIINGAYGGATIAQVVSDAVARVPFLAPYSTAIGFGLVVSVITYLSLVVGELVPKRLALSNPERIAVVAAVPMRALATFARPVVRLLGASNDLVLRLLGNRKSDEAPVTEDEIKILIQQGTQAGVFHAAEQELVERVFKLGDARIETLMTPRHEVSGWTSRIRPSSSGASSWTRDTRGSRSVGGALTTCWASSKSRPFWHGTGQAGRGPACDRGGRVRRHAGGHHGRGHTESDRRGFAQNPPPGADFLGRLCTFCTECAILEVAPVRRVGAYSGARRLRG